MPRGVNGADPTAGAHHTTTTSTDHRPGDASRRDPIESDTTIDPGLEPSAPSADASHGPGGAEGVKALAAKDKANGEKIIDVITKPTSQSSTSVTYKVHARRIKAGESIYFAVPKELAQRSANFMILGHTQMPSDDTDHDGDERDATPAHTSVQLHAHNFPEDEAWRYWGGPASGDKGAKFARVADHAEIENLYEWKKQGHHSVSSGASSHGDLFADAIRVCSVGVDPVVLYEVTLKVLPPKATHFDSVIFGTNAKLPDPKTGGGASYGRTGEGTYPGALSLGSGGGGDGKAKLPSNWKLSGSQLSIELPAGKKLCSVEVMGGDVHPDGKPNRDGGTGTKGWSKLNIGIQKAGGGTDWFMKNENVPAKGVMAGAPGDLDYVIQPGDKVIIRADNDTTYVTGLRVGTRD